MILNVCICLFAATYVAYSWNDPSAAFGCGLNLGVSIWCFFDFLKDAAKT